MMLRLPTLCADVFSLAILISETVRAYGAKLAGHPFTSDAMQYADIVEWQNELLQGEEAAAGREFWREYLRRAQSWQKFQLPFESNSFRSIFIQTISVFVARGAARSFCSGKRRFSSRGSAGLLDLVPFAHQWLRGNGCQL